MIPPFPPPPGPPPAPPPSPLPAAGAPSPPAPPSTFAAGPENAALRERVIAVLKTVYDPEIPVNIYEMGMIYEVRADLAGEVYVKMTLTSPMCPVAGSLPPEVEAKVRKTEGATGVNVDLVWDPPWDMAMMSEGARLQLGM